jgi:hypothetical protein
MTNYRQFYNAWQGFAKPKRELLLERTVVAAQIEPDDFLTLTTDQEELKRIMSQPSIKEPFDAEKAGVVSLAVELDDSGNAKVVDHEGRNRCYAAKMAGLKKVPLNVIVVNKEGATFGDIKQFTGQYTPVVVKRIKLSTRDATFDTKNPLRIQGDSRDFKGYSIRSKYDNEADGMRFIVQKLYNNDNALQSMGYEKFVEAVNKAYTITDSSGQTYIYARTQLYPHKNEKTRGLIYLNLQPHPVEVHGSIEAANEQTYTIKKK